MTLHQFLLAATFAAGAPMQAQFICVPGHNCSCDDEKVLPNLTITQPVTLEGTLFDQSGAPIAFEKTFIQVRDARTNNALASAQLDSEGRFDLGKIPRGTFRLIAFRQKGEVVSRLPLFDEPQSITCGAAVECKVKITLKIHGTDQPFETCPPK